jgi:hypothetical protein
MPLSAGDKLDPYEIVAPIGAGGMGEVYRARDSRLNRDVAIKVSLEKFSDRFEREARAVAALNHPNVCTLYDVGPNYLVMELIEGEAPKGPLPVEEALRIARQIGSALDAAHSKGIVHRDLKSANIKIKPDGTVKVLDFGLAKTADTPAGDPENSPTMTVSPTHAGMIMGTAAYMSPEQARGKSVDKRADIWAFGVVLYELLTGARPFHGEDLTEILASVVKDTPDLSKAPEKARRLLAKCLEKDPEKRLRDIGDAWELLEEPVAAAKRSVIWPWVAVAMLGAVLGVAGWLRPGRGQRSVTLSLLAPAGKEFVDAGSIAGTPEVSPDGSAVLYRERGGVYVRRLDSLDAKLVPGSEEVSTASFWSSDSTTVVYPGGGSPRQWRKVLLPDGAPQALAPSPTFSRGGGWSDTGTILVSMGNSLYASQPGNEEFRPLELPDRLGEGRNIYPEFLPATEDFLFCRHHANGDREEGEVYLATFRDGKGVNPSLLMKNATPARYTPAGDGRILFVRNDNLYSQRLNRGARKLEGEAQLVVRGVASAERADFSVARNGTIAWRPGTAAQSLITEFNRQGTVVSTSGQKTFALDVKLSPDEKQFLALRGTVSLFDVAQAGRIDLPKGVAWIGWFKRGSMLLGLRGEALVEMPAAGSGEIREIRKWERADLLGESVSSDGKEVLEATNPGQLLLSVRVEGTPEEVRPRELAKNASSGSFSPDGRWVMYRTGSNDAGGLYVQPFPGPGSRRQIVPKSVRAVWRGDGKEILYVDGDSLMSVAVEGSGDLTFRTPRKLFSGLRLPAGSVSNSVPLAVSSDGSRIFWLQALEQPESNVIHVRTGAVK